MSRTRDEPVIKCPSPGKHETTCPGWGLVLRRPRRACDWREPGGNSGHKKSCTQKQSGNMVIGHGEAGTRSQGHGALFCARSKPKCCHKSRGPNRNDEAGCGHKATGPCSVHGKNRQAVTKSRGPNRCTRPRSTVRRTVKPECCPKITLWTQVCAMGDSFSL